MIERHDSVIVQTFARILTPLAQLFAFYVLAHGHYGPGGGFQAGVILGATYILAALAFGRETLDRLVDERLFLALGAAGVGLYVLTGVAAMPFGAPFLDYGSLPLPVATAREARYLGILLIEAGVMLAVAATLVVIFCRLADRGPAA
jgi:multicomponent Na+:H+ antiporter subunit B